MEPFWLSAVTVAVAEIGDKTQLLAIVLAAKFRRPVPIILGILAATLLNHAAAAGLGFLAGALLKGRVFQICVGLAFVAMAAWALVPDKEEEEATLDRRRAGGVLLTTLITFFLVEIGDKTQIATSLLAARFHQITLVAAGTTLGMMAANVPAVLLGEVAAKRIPLKLVRMAAAVIFGILGAVAVVGALTHGG
ncbi:MAG TPA: TMEM165/GDT1 family protein [Caulobacteraceae bacterium]|nr:TMEM165/GDT1 family protein [Caulobacteraceae bacterium]